MSSFAKIFAFSLLSGALASQAIGVAPISLELNPIHGDSRLARRQVQAADSETPLRFSQASGWSTPVKIGANTFNLAVSTQDADTWVVSEQIKCANPPGAPADYPQPPCKFGARYKLPGTFAKFGDGTAVISGASAFGTVGYESVSVGGVTVPRQIIGLVNNGAGTDESVSGGLGLGTAIQSDMGFPANRSRLQYTPLFDTMLANRLIKAPVFSLALTTTGGSIAFGGLPRSVRVDGGSWASAPIIGDTYAVKADGFVAEGQRIQSQLILLIDMSTPGILLPKPASDAINNKIHGAKFRDVDGLYSVACDTKITGPVGIVLGGKQFLFSPSDLIVKDPDVPGGCLTNIGAMNSTTDGVLGDTFLKGVVTVFDPTNKRIQFAKKQ